MVIGEAFIAVKPDHKGFGPETEKGVLSSVSGIAKKVAGIFAGAFVLKQGFDLAGGFVEQAREANKVAAQTAAAITSTGGAAKVSAGDIDQLASSISRKTGIDDEAIQKGQNLLLTFTNVRNEVGKDNDIFNQASATLVDMGAALGGDASSSAIQLGKALNDPIAGITALTRVGVTFSKEQKESIKTMVESGDILGAQKVILKELNTEFGGSAAAQATAADRLSVTWGNVQEQLGNYLIPILDKAATFLADNLPGAIDTATSAAASLRDTLKPVVEGVRQVLGVLFSGDFEGGGPFAEDSDFIAGVFTFRDIMQDTVIPLVKEVATWIGDHLEVSLLAVGAAFLAVTAPVTGVIAGLAYLYLRFQGVRDGVNRVIEGTKAFVEFIQRDVMPVVTVVARYVAEQFGNLVRAVQDRWDKIKDAVTNVLTAIKIAVAVVLAPILLIWSQFHDQILAIVGAVWEQVKNVIETGLRIITDIIDVVLSLLAGDWQGAWDALKDIPAAALDFVKESISNALEIVKQLFSAAWQAVTDGVSGAFDQVVQFVTDLPGRLGAVGSGMFDFILSSFKAVLNSVIGLWNDLKIPSITIGGWDPPGPGPSFPSFTTPEINFPDLPTLAGGGLVRGGRGGILANIGEGNMDELVAPLPPGVIAGLLAIAQGRLAGDMVQIDVDARGATNPWAVGRAVSVEYAETRWRLAKR